MLGRNWAKPGTVSPPNIFTVRGQVVIKSGKTNMKNANWKGMQKNSGMGPIYFLGLVGALVYFLQTSTSLVQGLIGVLKALVWPAILVYDIFKLLKL